MFCGRIGWALVLEEGDFMAAIKVAGMFLFQGDVAGDTHTQMIFVGIIAFCSLFQVLVFVGAGIAALRAYKSVSAEIGMLKAKAMPIVGTVQGVVEDLRPKINNISGKVQEIVEDVTPKVKTVSTNVADMSTVARNKVHEFEATLDSANQTIRGANDKTRAQMERVDGMVSSALKATSDVGNTIHRGIRTPIVEVAGVVNGIKAALDVLVGRVKGSGGSPSGPSGSSAYERGTPRPVYSATGPTAVSPREPVSSHPSSNIAPSPGAEAVLEKFRSEKVKTIY